MANIGSFKKVGDEFRGEILTLSVQTKNVRIVAESNRSNDNAPSHRVYVGRAEIGAAWSKRSNDGRDYLAEAGRSFVQRADLREPVRRRGRRKLHPHLVAQPQVERRMSKTSPNRPARIPGGAFVLPLCAEPLKNCRCGKQRRGRLFRGSYPGFGPRLRAIAAAQRCGGMPALWSAAAFVTADALTASPKSRQRMPFTAAR
jgi:hypothetical protein